jgi:hypothetical protein
VWLAFTVQNKMEFIFYGRIMTRNCRIFLQVESQVFCACLFQYVIYDKCKLEFHLWLKVFPHARQKYTMGWLVLIKAMEFDPKVILHQLCTKCSLQLSSLQPVFKNFIY